MKFSESSNSVRGPSPPATDVLPMFSRRSPDVLLVYTWRLSLAVAPDRVVLARELKRFKEKEHGSVPEPCQVDMSMALVSTDK